jgi:hypothetical protein
MITEWLKLEPHIIGDNCPGNIITFNLCAVFLFMDLLLPQKIPDKQYIRVDNSILG